MRKILLFLGFCFFTGISPLFPQASATANFTASATIIEPIGINTTANMSFANIDAKSGGAVILSPENTRTASGGIKLTNGGHVSAAAFKVTGQSGYTFNISLPKNSHQLVNGSESMQVQDFTSNYSGEGLAESGNIIRIGASLIVNPNQKPGDYKTLNDLQVTVNYN